MNARKKLQEKKSQLEDQIEKIEKQLILVDQVEEIPMSKLWKFLESITELKNKKNGKIKFEFNDNPSYTGIECKVTTIYNLLTIHEHAIEYHLRTLGDIDDIEYIQDTI